MITLRFTTVDGAEISVSVKGHEYGSDEVAGRRQIIGQSLGEQVYVYEIADGDDRILNIQLINLTAAERADLEWFFSRQNARGALRWFTIDVPNAKMVPLHAGAEVDGVVVRCGDGHRAGDYITPDLIRHTVRLTTPKITWPEPIDGHYSATMTLKVLEGFLPSNFV